MGKDTMYYVPFCIIACLNYKIVTFFLNEITFSKG